MKAVNLNFHGTDNIKTTICWILSILAWSFFLGIGWTSIFLKDDFLWTLVRKTDLYIPFYGDDVYPYFPIQINKYFIYIIFCATLLISTIAFSAYLIYSICIKKTSVFNGMMGKITRFHFIPLFCASAIFMIGHFIEVNNKGLEIFRDIDIKDIKDIKDIIDIKDIKDIKDINVIINYKKIKDLYKYLDLDTKNRDKNRSLIIISMVFAAIGIITLTIVHTQTIIEPWYASLLIKKGAFSFLIALFGYSLFYCGLEIGIIQKIDEFSPYNIAKYILEATIDEKKTEVKNLINNAATSLSICIGVLNIGLSIGLKDPTISFANLLIYIGMAIYFYKVDEKSKDVISGKDNGDGPIDIVMMVLSALAISLIFLQNKADTFK